MTTRTVLSIAAAFAVGALISHLPAQDRHVYELRTYHTLPGRLDALIARFRDHTTTLFEKHGMRNVGYWVPADTPASQNTLIYILEHDSREAAKKSWDDFQNDPEWKKVRDASEADGKIVEKIDSVYMTSTDFSKLK
jgi:hypothetical protein